MTYHSYSFKVFFSCWQVLSSGIFEMVVTSVFNPNGRRLDGTCCNVMSDERCQDECRTFITSCLLQYTSAVSDDPDCIYGNKTSRVIGGNDIRKNFTDNSSSLSMSFKFSWPVGLNLCYKINLGFIPWLTGHFYSSKL